MNVIRFTVQKAGCFGAVCDVYKTAALGDPVCACVSSLFFETVNNFT